MCEKIVKILRRKIYSNQASTSSELQGDFFEERAVYEITK